MSKIIVSEYVSQGHPDKIADQISDALLDEYLKIDKNTRAGIEVMVKDNVVVLGGEVTANGTIDYDKVVRKVFERLNFPSNHNLSPSSIKIINLIGKQSEEISKGVNKEEIGAGDQGFCVGFASNETSVYLPLGVYLAKTICQYVSNRRDLELGPDTKSQVIVEYGENGEIQVSSILVSTMHQNQLEVTKELVTQMIKNNAIGIDKEVFEKYNISNVRIDVNPCGEWKIGGSVSDCGVTGRKIVVDQFGGYCNVGGGALSGKDMTKVDRSAAYMARYIAKNIVAANLASTAKVELSYMIGIAKPSSLSIEVTNGKVDVNEIIKWVEENIDLTPNGIIKRFHGTLPQYVVTAIKGHYGFNDFSAIYPWEKMDLVEQLKDVFSP